MQRVECECVCERVGSIYSLIRWVLGSVVRLPRVYTNCFKIWYPGPAGPVGRIAVAVYVMADHERQGHVLWRSCSCAVMLVRGQYLDDNILETSSWTPGRIHDVVVR